jgi:hypothetical protein
MEVKIRLRISNFSGFASESPLAQRLINGNDSDSFRTVGTESTFGNVAHFFTSINLSVVLERPFRLGLGNHCNGNLEPWNPDRYLRALTSRRICRKPLEPLFVHPGEIVFLG